jgi:hypothetical protein
MPCVVTILMICTSSTFQNRPNPVDLVGAVSPIRVCISGCSVSHMWQLHFRIPVRIYSQLRSPLSIPSLGVLRLNLKGKQMEMLQERGIETMPEGNANAEWNSTANGETDGNGNEAGKVTIHLIQFLPSRQKHSLCSIEIF